MNFPRLTVDDVIAIRRVLMARADEAEGKGHNRAAEKYRMLAERIMEIA